MRDYTKQNKSVFLSNGRCVFEADAPRYEAEIERETLSSRELPLSEEMAMYKGWVDRVERWLPEAPKSTQRKNCKTCANSPWGRPSMCGYMVEGFDACAPELIGWRLSNTNKIYVLNDGADNCPGWKGKEG